MSLFSLDAFSVFWTQEIKMYFHLLPDGENKNQHQNPRFNLRASLALQPSQGSHLYFQVGQKRFSIPRLAHHPPFCCHFTIWKQNQTFTAAQPGGVGAGAGCNTALSSTKHSGAVAISRPQTLRTSLGLSLFRFGRNSTIFPTGATNSPCWNGGAAGPSGRRVVARCTPSFGLGLCNYVVVALETWIVYGEYAAKLSAQYLIKFTDPLARQKSCQRTAWKQTTYLEQAFDCKSRTAAPKCGSGPCWRSVLHGRRWHLGSWCPANCKTTS